MNGAQMACRIDGDRLQMGAADVPADDTVRPDAHRTHRERIARGRPDRCAELLTTRGATGSGGGLEWHLVS